MKRTTRTVGSVLGAGFAVLLFCGLGVAEDQVVMKDGTIWQGEIIENDARSPEIILNTGEKNLPIMRHQIKNLCLDKVTRAEYQRRLQEIIRGGNADAHFALGKWAESVKLFSLAEERFAETIRKDPQHGDARRKSGYVMVEGQWYTEEDAAQYQQQSSRDEPAPSKTDQGQSAQAKLTAEQKKALEEQAVRICRTLGDKASELSKKQEAVAEIVASKEQIGYLMLGCLDMRNNLDEIVRMGALSGLKVASPVGQHASAQLAWSAVHDPSQDVNAAATALIKERKDEVAVGGLVRNLIGAFDPAGNVRSAPVRDAAVKSLRAMEDERIGRVLLYYVWLEMRPTVTRLESFNTRQIDSFTINQGASVSVIIPLSFPIQFPELAIEKVRTTVSAPAAAYRAYISK